MLLISNNILLKLIAIICRLRLPLNTHETSWKTKVMHFVYEYDLTLKRVQKVIESVAKGIHRDRKKTAPLNMSK